MTPEASADLLAFFFLLAVDVLRVALVLFVAWLLVPHRRQCPRCSQETAPVAGSFLLRWLMLQRRWCMACGWTGLARRARLLQSEARSPGSRVTPVLLLLALVSCRPAAEDPVAALFATPEAWIDLSHPFDERTIYWPTAEPFRLTRVTEGLTAGGYFYAASNFSAAEHGGTHLDAPIHFAAGKHTTDQIPLDQFIGPARVVDVSGKAAANADYLVSVADLDAFESAHGAIGPGDIVLFQTGWGGKWGDRKAYLGTDLTGPRAVPALHFPGVDSAAARSLVGKRVAAVGIDTPSIDYGQSTGFHSHRILFAANIPAFENVANLDRLPPIGAYVIALPMKITGGTGGPLRVVAAWPRRLPERR